MPLEDAADTAADAAHDPYAAWRLPDFRRFLLGNFVATVGAQMQNIAVGWDLYERTGKPLALGLVGLVQVLPVLLLTLPAGHVADRYPRRTVLAIAILCIALGSVGLAIASVAHAAIGWTYLSLAIAGIGRAFYGPAREALYPALLPRRLYANAASWRSSSWQLASVAGPALGGLLIAMRHSALPAYIIDALFAFAFIVVIVRLPASVDGGSHDARAAGIAPASREAATLGSVVAGVRFVMRTRILLAAITLDMFAVLLGGSVALLPVFAKDILHVGPRGLGWMTAAPAIGAFLTAIVLAHRPPMRRAGIALIIAVCGFGAATIAFGLSRSFPLSLAMLALTGAFDNVSVVIRSTLLQLLTPDDMRGRVGAVNSLFLGGSNELGAFESGAAAAAVGPRAAVALGGVGTILVVLAAARIWPELRRLGALADLSIATHTAHPVAALTLRPQAHDDDSRTDERSPA